MVNVKMVNGFMETKQYITPMVESMDFRTELMAVTGPGTAAFHPGMPARYDCPAHRTPVF